MDFSGSDTDTWIPGLQLTSFDQEGAEPTLAMRTEYYNIRFFFTPLLSFSILSNIITPTL